MEPMTLPDSAIPSLTPSSSSQPGPPVAQMPPLDSLKAEKARRRLREFVEQAWHVLEPSTVFVPGMACDAICEHLQAVSEGLLGDLIINVPPGTAKSLLTAVFW